MKITQQNETLMILKDWPTLPFFIGLIFILVGIIMIFFPSSLKESPPVWVGVIFFILGCFASLSSKITTITIDKANDKISFYQRGFFGTENENFTLSQIKEIRIKKEELSKLFSIVFLLKNGEEIPLGNNFSSVYRAKRKLAEKISTFIKIPFQEDFTPSIKDISEVAQKIIEKSKNKEINNDKKDF